MFATCKLVVVDAITIVAGAMDSAQCVNETVVTQIWGDEIENRHVANKLRVDVSGFYLFAGDIGALQSKVDPLLSCIDLFAFEVGGIPYCGEPDQYRNEPGASETGGNLTCIGGITATLT